MQQISDEEPKGLENGGLKVGTTANWYHCGVDNRGIIDTSSHVATPVAPAAKQGERLSLIWEHLMTMIRARSSVRKDIELRNSCDEGNIFKENSHV